MKVELKILNMLQQRVNNVIKSAGELIGDEPLNFQRQQYQILTSLIEKYMKSKQKDIFYDINTLLKITETYLTIHVIENESNDLFKKIHFALNHINKNTYISEVYLISKMQENAKQHINGIKNINIECFVKSILFIAKFGAIYLKKEEVLYLNILYFDTYKKENILELAKVIKIDGSKVICENDSEYFMIENDEVVIFHKPLKNGIENIIKEDVFFENTTSPKGFKVEISLTDCV